MPWAAVLALLQRGGPALLKALPLLWPMMSDAKRRKMLFDGVKEVTNRSPSKRLRGRVQATIAIAEEIAAGAQEKPEQDKAERWAKRGRHLLLKLDLPIAEREAKAANRQEVKEQLDDLNAQMQEHLGPGAA